MMTGGSRTKTVNPFLPWSIFKLLSVNLKPERNLAFMQGVCSHTCGAHNSLQLTTSMQMTYLR